jgi:antitoxin component of MazEF toxin-antitoxin module
MTGFEFENEGGPKLTLEELLSHIRSENLHGEQKWGPPVGNEVW